MQKQKFKTYGAALCLALGISAAIPSNVTAADLMFGESVSSASCVGVAKGTINKQWAESTYGVASIKSGGTSLNPDYSFIEKVWPHFIEQATYAAVSGNAAAQKTVYEQLHTMAENKVALSTRRREDTELCYAKGADKPCNWREYEMAFQYFSYYSYVAYLIKPYIDQQPDAALIRDYLKDGYKKYIKTRTNPASDGLQGLLDGYIGMYSYAMFADNPTLAKQALRQGIAHIKRQLNKDGLIKFSSYRGVRALFYHSYGVDVMLSFGELAERNGIQFFDDPQLGPRIRKAIELEIQYAPNPKAFEAKGTAGADQDGRKAYSTDEKDAKRSIHSQALATAYIVQKRFPDLLDAKTRNRYFSKSDYGVLTDMASGFVPGCVDWTSGK